MAHKKKQLIKTDALIKDESISFPKFINRKAILHKDLEYLHQMVHMLF